MDQELPEHEIVLLGAGHTNAHIIRSWRMKPLPGVRLTCVSDHLEAVYSGMLAGMLAGEYNEDRMKIDLVRLCASCGVRLVHGRGVGLDLAHRQLLVEGRPPIHYDALSIGIGSRPRVSPGGENGLSIKPMQTFLSRLRVKLDQALTNNRSGPLRVAIVGGGAAGVEIACCLDEFIRRNCSAQAPMQIILVDADNEILYEKPPRARHLVAGELRRRGIELKLEKRIEYVERDCVLICECGERIDADLTIWTTSAQPAAVLTKLGLQCDEHGFLLTRTTLQSVGDDCVFAVGDSGTVEGDKYAKAGVFAVRQGPVLWENLRRKLRGEPLLKWKRQRHFLSIVNTGRQRAILTYRRLSLHGKWWWRWKDHIDSRFMDQYQQYPPPMLMEAPTREGFDLSRQCGGCGCKVSPEVLQGSLSDLNQDDDPRILVGLDEPDDIALLRNSTGGSTAVSTDFFSAFVDDPFLLGRVAAINAMSDLFAKGATPNVALSIAVLPPGTKEQQARLLRELLAGGAREFQPAGVTIVGGHSVVGQRLLFGFTILGDAEQGQVMRKTSPRAGDVLVLTKPLGTGVLLAAHMQAKCHAAWWSPLVANMLQSNQLAAEAAMQLSVSAATDITGFGLAGHLLEVLSSDEVTAEVSLSRLPALPGVKELLESGIQSSLAPANQANCYAMEVESQLAQNTDVNIMYDPQTSGGLLFAMPEAEAERIAIELSPAPTVIGHVRKRGTGEAKLHLVP